jgi:cytochrome P450
MMALTLRIAAKALMDSEVESDIADMDHAVNDLTDEMASRFRRPVLIPDWVPLPGHIRYRRAIATGERVISRMIAERRQNGFEGRTDFLSRLMQARDEHGRAMSDRQLRDETLTMLLAGHETTALALSWSLFLLGQNPRIGRHLADEVAAVVGSREVTVDDIPKLKLTESIVLESMRLYPPAWVIGRENVGGFGLRDYDFKPGTTIFIAPWVLHRDRRHYEEPEAFRPERWLDGLARRLPRYAYMPFGGGPRICIGQRFAMIEAVVILATIAQRFGVEWQSDRPVVAFPSITLRPIGGVWIRLAAPSRHVH